VALPQGSPSLSIRDSEERAPWPLDTEVSTASKADRVLLEEWIAERAADPRFAPNAMLAQDNGSGLMVGGSVAHALTSCRRILKAVADVAFPAQSEPIVGQDGEPRVVDDDHYKN
jgi:hypothetical protein